MTREEALAENIRNYLESDIDLFLTDDDYRTIIKVLEQEPCDVNSEVIDAVIEWLKDKDIIKTNHQEERARGELIDYMGQEPKTGHWIKNKRTFYTCDKCGFVNHYNRKKYNYCPNCGAKMESEV